MTDYTSYRDSKGLSNNDIIRAIRDVFPRYSKAQHSMVSNPGKNGVCLLPEAESLLVKTWGYGPGLSISEKLRKKRKSHDNKDKPRRLYVRISDAMFERVDAAMKRMSFATTQDFIEAAIQQMLDKYGM